MQTQTEMQREVDEAVRTMRAGGIILYPTDTVWGLGCDATSAAAVERIYRLKRSGNKKSMLVLCASADMIVRYVNKAPGIAFEVMELATSPLTAILPGAAGLAENLIPDEGTLGVRIPDHEFCRRMLRALGRPIVSTSANISGEATPVGLQDVAREIIDDATVMDLRRQPEAFTAGYYRTRERFGAALYANAMLGNTAMTFHGKSFPTTGSDELCLFSKSHPSILDAKFLQSNQFADEFSEDALAAMESAMQDFKGDTGEVLDVHPDTILIPNNYKLKKAVFAAIGADKDPNTSNNAFNFLFGRWNVIVWPYLNEWLGGDTTAWVLLDSGYNIARGGAEWLNRVNLEVRSELASNDANVWKGYARFTGGFADWRFAAVGGVSGGTQLVSA